MHPLDGPRQVILPPLAGPLDGLWELILDLAEHLPPARWALVGGQMVMLHGRLAGRVATRASEDVDVLADLLADEAALTRCVRAVRELGLQPRPDSAGKVYRFVREADNARADVLAPDRFPPRRRLRTIGGDTIRVPGGTQALQRTTGVQVVKGARSATLPLPDLIGALVLKAAAWATDSRDRERHSGDAAFLASLITDPIAERDRFKGSDRKRLRLLDTVLGNADGEEWRRLGEHADDGYAVWRLLLA